jgi:iron complex outermembrane receptor protein
LACAAVVATTASAARAQEQPAAFGARARVQGAIAATNAEDPTASGTELDVRGRTRALEQVSEALVEAPGVRVQESGGVGAFSGVALRGAEAGQTAVLLGSIPLTSADSGAFDLGTLPLAVLDAIEVYRGGAPVWFSEGAIGGVVRFVPRSARQNLLRLDTGYGAYGRFELAATSAVVRDGGARPGFFSFVGLTGADNDYPYVDDGQTRFDRSDDRTLRQRNARALIGDGLLHAGVDALGGRLEAVLAGHAQSEGIPGPLAAPTLNVHRQLVSTLGAVSWERERLDADGERRYRVQLLASGSEQQSRFSDLGSELGTSQVVASDDAWWHGYVRAAGSLRVLPYLTPTLIASFTRDDYRPSDALAFRSPPRPSGRDTEALALEARAFGRVGGVPVELRPSLRLAASQTAVWVDGMRDDTAQRQHILTATYRVAAAVAPLPALSLSASAATGTRLPTMLELFGDRVFQQPNPELEPERGRSVDASAVARGSIGDYHANAELRGFAMFIDDLIRFERTAQFTVRPANIASGRILGFELGTRQTYGRHLALAAALTAMQTRNQFGQALPLRPPLQFTARPELALFPAFAARLTLFAEVEHVSYVYLDDANLTFLGARTLLSSGAALRFLGGHVTLALRVRNLFDAQTVDALSRPLPGRQWLLSLAIEDAPG